MKVAATDGPTSKPAGTAKSGEIKNSDPRRSSDPKDLAAALGIWLSGIDSFVNAGNRVFVDGGTAKASRDWAKEFRLTHSVLLRCADLNHQLLKELKDRPGADLSFDGQAGFEPRVSAGDLVPFSAILRDAVILNESLLRAEPLKFGDWKAWSSMLDVFLSSSPAFAKLIDIAENAGSAYLPEQLKTALQKNSRTFSEQADLEKVLPRIAKILKWLSVVGQMLANDEPLKPSLLVFARVQEQTRELINFIDNRLLRFPNADEELFASLDGASYTASMELRKVYDFELTGLAGIRPSPSIFARIETAYSLLNDSFEQILTGFARLADPKIDGLELFPSFKVKLEQSLTLRRDLAAMLKVVHAAEQKPEKSNIETLRTTLRQFLDVSVKFLFYKDRETVERFIEEIVVTEEPRDIVSILHRFGAFLETLLGQVNMRTVLANYPPEGK